MGIYFERLSDMLYVTFLLYKHLKYVIDNNLVYIFDKICYT